MCTDKFTFRKLSCNGTYTRVYFTDNENVSLWEKDEGIERHISHVTQVSHGWNV